VDAGEDTTLGDGDSSEDLLELLIVSDGELDVSGIDAGLLVVSGGVASELADLGGKILKDGGQVDGSAGTDSVSPLAIAEHSVDSADGELKTSSGRSALLACLGGFLVHRFSSGHFHFFVQVVNEQ
jgi:hypothetical protein